METKFSQVAHLYLGCEIEDDEKPLGTTAILDSVDTNGDCYYNYYNNETYQSDTDSVMCHVDDIKPILKDLSDITEGDFKELAIVLFGEDKGNKISELNDKLKEEVKRQGIRFFHLTPERFHLAPKLFTFLLSKSYDLHNLLSTNQAINAKKL